MLWSLMVFGFRMDGLDLNESSKDRSIQVESPRGSGSDRVPREERLVCEAENVRNEQN